MHRKARAYTALFLGSAAAVSPLAQTPAALAAANPGQAINNDYGQSPTEVAAEIASQVAARPAVINAKAALASAHNTTVAKKAAEQRARRAYLAAKASHKTTRIRAAKRALTAAHTAAVHAAAAEAAARGALNSALATSTAAVNALHYLPVDGTYTGDVFQYFIPGIGLEPIQVGITVYGGHVSSVSVPQYASTGDSAQYNAMALPILINAAMTANDTAAIASVSGASLTSEAFTKSLQSALTKAGFKG